MITTKTRFTGALFAAAIAAVLASGSALAQQQCPASIAGTLSATSPTQTGRILRDGVASSCFAAKAFPGLTGGATLYAYDSYRFTNHTGAAACVRFGLTVPAASQAHLVAYTTFVPAQPNLNYLADSGLSATSNTVSMSLNLAAGAAIDVVVHTPNAGVW